MTIRHKTLTVALVGAIITSAGNAEEKGDAMPPWQPGMMDLHHINTGRGDATFYIFPDGTSMLFDAGDLTRTGPRVTKLTPDDSKQAGQWITDYIRQFHPKGNKATLDYALISHFHDDHMGGISDKAPKSKLGNYQISGISQVAESLKIKTLVDRTYPDYTSPRDMGYNAYKAKGDGAPEGSMENYWRFQEAHIAKNGMVVEKLDVGSNSQFQLKYQKDNYPNFIVRNMHGNGHAWTGWGQESFDMLSVREPAEENPLSLGIRLTYGKFDYYTGGDIAGNDSYGAADLARIDPQVAPVIGAVDIATLNHHGNRDSMSNYFVRSVRAKVWIGQGWSANHPGDDVLRRLMSPSLYPGDRLLFSTNVAAANRTVIGDNVDNFFDAQQGHIVVRVAKGGTNYKIFVLDHMDKKRRIIKTFGPFDAR